MIGRKTKTINNEPATCEICGKTNKGLKLERHEGVALLTCNSCRQFGATPQRKKRKTSRDKAQSKPN